MRLKAIGKRELKCNSRRGLSAIQLRHKSKEERGSGRGSGGGREREGDDYWPIGQAEDLDCHLIALLDTRHRLRLSLEQVERCKVEMTHLLVTS